MCLQFDNRNAIIAVFVQMNVIMAAKHCLTTIRCLQTKSVVVLQETGVAYRWVEEGSEVTANKIAVRQLFLYKCEKFHGWSYREASRRHGSCGRPCGYRCLSSESLWASAVT